MGNASIAHQSISVETDLESVQITGHNQSDSGLINHNSAQFASKVKLNNSTSDKQSNCPDLHNSGYPVHNERNELDLCATKRTLFVFKKKKRKNKSCKSDLAIKSNQQIENELIELISTKHVQAGNGLISLINLNNYLQSDTEYHLVNRIIKRIGLYNQETQTDFRPFDDECTELQEVSQNLVQKLINLKKDQLIVEEDHSRSNELFNMVYSGKNNQKQNRRNVCIQRCIGQSSVGTQTIESRVHLIIIEILNRLSSLNEQAASSIDQVQSSQCSSTAAVGLCVEECDQSERSVSSQSNYRIIRNFDENHNSDQLNGQFDDCFCRYTLDKHLPKRLPVHSATCGQQADSLIDKLENLPFQNNQSERKTIAFDWHSVVNDLQTLDQPKSSSQLVSPVGLADSGVSSSFRMESDENSNDENTSMNLIRTSLQSMNKEKLEEYLKNLLLQMSQEHQKKVKSCNACVQTMNDIITDELPEYAARCPNLRKKELIYSSTLFDAFDKRAVEAPQFFKLDDLVDYLIKDCENDMFKVRTLFRWITQNMSFDWKYVEEQHKRMVHTINRFKLNVTDVERETDVIEFNNNVIKEEDEEAYLNDECLLNECRANECNQSQTRLESIYRTKKGGSKEFVELFMEMCKKCEIRCKLIQGFAKNYDYRPGHLFHEEDISNLTNVHYWAAIFVLGNWHLIDLTWATGYTDPMGRFQRKFNEFFFFTDPEHLIYTHFPFNKSEREYDRWQLLDKPISLNSFNNLPKITANFLSLNLKIRSKISNPVSFKVQTEIRISSHEPIRYKYKLFHVDELENHALNNFVFCQLKGERLIASFVVCPPIAGRYFFKIYARPEKEMQDQNPINASLHYILTMLLDCNKARKYQNPYPLNELPYGPVQAFYNFKMQLINQHSAIISTFGGKRKLTLQCHEPMMITYQIVDADGQEQDIRAIIQRDDENSTNVITLNILPPRVGLFKLSIFGAPRPKPNQKGKTRLPLLSTFLIDCRLAKIVSKNIDPDPLSADLIDDLGKKLN